MKLLITLCLTIYCLCFNYTVHAQQIDSTFLAIANTQFKIKTPHYSELDSIFKPYAKDSLAMRYLIEQSKATPSLLIKGYAENELGIIYRNLSLYDKALRHHNNALIISDSVKNNDLKINAYNMLGVVYRRLDNVRLALDNHQQALKLADKTTKKTPYILKSIAISQNSMGNIYLALKQYDLALKQFEASIKIEYKVDNKLGLAINHHNIGYAHEALKHYDLALEYYKNSLQYNQQINSDVGRIICNNSIGHLLILQNQYQEAYNTIKPNINLAETIGDKFYIADSYYNLGFAALKLNRLQEAHTLLNKALNTAKQHQLKAKEAEVLILLSEINEKNGDTKTALSLYKQGIAIENSIINAQNTNYVNDLIIKYESERKTNEIKSLADQNEIYKLTIQRNRRGIFVSFISLILFLGVLLAIQRQRKLNNEKQVFHLKQEALRNQMNPHFIFNALNSIKLYIINNEQKKAAHYLNKFSKLIRKILEASSVKEVPLEEELQTMNLYMSIENIRFSNEIDFIVKVDEHINIEHIRVPPLILQPFLENALWHGLSSKKGDKKIWLTVSQQNQEFIDISIEDNGIGRTQSALIKQQKTIQRKSVGIDLTKDRLTNFVKDFKHTFALHFNDLYDNDNNAKGTQVVLSIPLV